MRRLFSVAALAALSFPALSFTGDMSACTGDMSAGSDGFRCENECPLAATANGHRAFGSEALVASSIVQAELYREVEQNLARI